MKFTTADVSLSKDVFDKAVKSALGRVNTHGISNLTQHQSKALLYFLSGKDSFVCCPTGYGKSLIYQLKQNNLGCGCFRTKKFYFWFERESMRRATRMCTSTLIFMAKWHLFGQRRDKQTARETIICRLAAGNFEDETVSVQNIVYRMTVEKFKYETNSTQMSFVEWKPRMLTRKRLNTKILLNDRNANLHRTQAGFGKIQIRILVSKNRFCVSLPKSENGLITD